MNEPSSGTRVRDSYALGEAGALHIHQDTLTLIVLNRLVGTPTQLHDIAHIHIEPEPPTSPPGCGRIAVTSELGHLAFATDDAPLTRLTHARRWVQDHAGRMLHPPLAAFQRYPLAQPGKAACPTCGTTIEHPLTRGRTCTACSAKYYLRTPFDSTRRVLDAAGMWELETQQAEEAIDWSLAVMRLVDPGESWADGQRAVWRAHQDAIAETRRRRETKRPASVMPTGRS